MIHADKDPARFPFPSHGASDAHIVGIWAQQIYLPRDFRLADEVVAG